MRGLKAVLVTLCLLLSARSSLQTVVECGELEDIANGQIVISGYTVGSTAMYSCNYGYVLDGKRTRFCQVTGEWSTPSSSGKAQSCNFGPICAEEGSTRLVNGNSDREGLVEICSNGAWGRVCDDAWDNADAFVVCNELGFPPEFSVVAKWGRFYITNDMVYFNRYEVSCTGQEENLSDCPHEYIRDCNLNEAAGVVCQGFNCTDGDVRLVQGSDFKEGRVEVCTNNTWGAICEGGINSETAEVVCGQLGLSESYATPVAFSPSRSPAVLERVNCSGSEHNLTECSWTAVNQSATGLCARHAGIQCEPPCTSINLNTCPAFGTPEAEQTEVERCYCTEDCIRWGDCCRDFGRLENCTKDVLSAPKECTDNDVRLVDGPTQWAGRLEVCLDGLWGSICRREFDDVDASVACRSMGFSSENAYALPSGMFGASRILWLSGVRCRGHEDSVLDCENQGGPGATYPCTLTTPNNATAVICGGENVSSCIDGELRLANGSTQRDGRVEVCLGGVWGSICNDEWDDIDASVVCRQLGLESKYAVAITEQIYGHTIGPIVWDDVQCDGTESNLTECRRSEVRVHNCELNQGVAVSCPEQVDECDAAFYDDHMTDNSGGQNATIEAIERFGSCEPYRKPEGTDFCESIFIPEVDYIYIPTRRSLRTQEELSTFAGEIISATHTSCNEVILQYICRSMFLSCGRKGELHLPVPVCPEDCTMVEDTCGDQWTRIKDELLLVREDVANCNKSGSILAPLPYCCQKIQVRSDTPSAAGQDNNGAAIGGAMAAIFVVAVAIGILSAVLYCYVRAAKLKIKQLKRTISLEHDLQELASRGGSISHSRNPTLKCYPDGATSFTTDLRYTKTINGPPVSHNLLPPAPPSPVTSKILRQLSSHMLIPSTQIRLLDSIGQGEFGIVYKAHLLKPPNMIMKASVAPQTVAVKTLKGCFDSSAIHEMLEESVKMKSFDHPHVISLIGVCVDAGPMPYLIMPYMSQGSLLNYLKKERAELLVSADSDEDEVLGVQKRLLNVCSQIASGMEYLSQKKFVHRDLAARNCMIDTQYVIKVSDFGLSEDVYSKNYFRQEKSAAVKLPVKWMALESLTDGVFTEKTDVWSFGVTCWEVFSAGKSPYPGLDPMTLTKMLETGVRMDKPINAACPDTMYEVMIRCWDQEPDARPSFSEIFRDIQILLTGLADYLSLESITGFVNPANVVPSTATEPEETGHRDRHASNLEKSSSTSSLNLKKHDIVTPVGISIHLERSPSIILEDEQTMLHKRTVSVQSTLADLVEETSQESSAEYSGSDWSVPDTVSCD